MDALTGGTLAAGALLVLAGAQKVRDPLPLVRALLSVGVPGRAPRWRTPVRVVAAAELLLGLAALVHPSGLPAAGVALSYAAFTVFVLAARARGGVLASCGCFGRADTPPTRTHAAVTAGLASCAAATVPGADPSLLLLPLAALLAALCWAAMAVLPTVGARA